MRKMTDQKYLVTSQYKHAGNLQTRSNLHARYSVNPNPWFKWVFDQFKLESGSRILEIGCGTGELWVQNRERIPADWHFVLGDLSYGMLQAAKQNLSFLADQAVFQTLDAQLLRFEHSSFDAVIANHVLYHIPNPRRAILDVHRVLGPDGCFYVATNGSAHMQELLDLVKGYQPLARHFSTSVFSEKRFSTFSLENGHQQLAEFFDDIQLRMYPDALEVSEVKPLMDYIFSLIPEMTSQLSEQDRAEFERYLQANLDQNSGVVRIHKATGMFVACKSS